MKTQNISPTQLTQMTGEKATSEISQESFFKAFTNAQESEAGVGDKSEKDSDDIEDGEKLDVEKAEIPFVWWVPKALFLEEEVALQDLKQQHDLSPHLVEEGTLHPFEPSKEFYPVESFPFTEEFFETILQEKTVNSGIKEVPKDLMKAELLDINEMATESVNNPKMKSAEQTGPVIKESVEKVFEHQRLQESSTPTIDQKTSDFSKGIHSIISKQDEAKASLIDHLIIEQSTAQKTENTEGAKKSFMQLEHGLPESETAEVGKSEIVSEKSMQLESETETVHPIREKSSKELDVAVKMENPARQMETIKPQTAHVTEVQEKIKVPAEQWVNNVESMILEQINDKGHVDQTVKARLQLTPEKLGEMAIELIMDNKELTAKIVVESLETKDWLEQQVRQLSATLATQDIHIEDFEVVVFKENQGQLDTNGQDNPFFDQKEQEKKENKINHSLITEEDQQPKKHYKVNNSNDGRLSLWV